MDTRQDIPYGYCHCGCGEKTTLSRQGQPNRFINGHWSRTTRASHTVVPGGCWEWGGYRNRGGYGQLERDGRTISAHRWYYEQYVGPIPNGLELDHLCRNRACVNPDHLEPVTRTENVRRSRRSKLNYEIAARMREMRESGLSLRRIAVEFGVDPTTVRDVVIGKSWV